MSRRSNSFLIPWLVYIGAVGLIGLPAMGISFSVFVEFLPGLAVDGTITDSNWVDGALLLTAFGASMLIGLQIAYEATALQLGGIAALGRGPRWAVLLRHLGLSLLAIAVLVRIAWFGSSVLTTATTPALLAVGGMLVLATVWVLIRAASQFLAGYSAQSPTAAESDR